LAVSISTTASITWSSALRSIQIGDASWRPRRRSQNLIARSPMSFRAPRRCPSMSDEISGRP
jgi:hypothetical protein